MLFGPAADECELDMRENEILFFLLIIVMIKSRKTGATHSAAAYLASGFGYAKVLFLTPTPLNQKERLLISTFEFTGC